MHISTLPLAKYQVGMQANRFYHSLVEMKSKCVTEFVEFYVAQVLSEHVCRIVRTLEVKEFDLFLCHKFSNKVILDINVFGTLLSNWVGSNEHRSLIITTYRHR